MDGGVNFNEWGNLSALGCLIGMVLWFATKGLPSIMSKWATEAEKARLDFKEVTAQAFAESKEQRDDFREETRLQRASFEKLLTEQREQSARLASAGHDAVNTLASELRQLRTEVPRASNPAG